MSADLKSCHESKRCKVIRKYTSKQPIVSGKVQLALLAGLTLAAVAAGNWWRLRLLGATAAKIVVREVDVEDNAGNSFTIGENGDGTATVNISGTYTDKRTGDIIAFSAGDSADTNYSVRSDIGIDQSTNPERGCGVATATVNGTLTDWKTGERTLALIQVALAVDKAGQFSNTVNHELKFVTDPLTGQKTLTRVNRVGSRAYCRTNASYTFLAGGNPIIERTGDYGSISVFSQDSVRIR